MHSFCCCPWSACWRMPSCRFLFHVRCFVTGYLHLCVSNQLSYAYPHSCWYKNVNIKQTSWGCIFSYILLYCSTVENTGLYQYDIHATAILQNREHTSKTNLYSPVLWFFPLFLSFVLNYIYIPSLFLSTLRNWVNLSFVAASMQLAVQKQELALGMSPGTLFLHPQQTCTYS